MQGDWVVDGMTRGGGPTMHARWWLTDSGGGGRGFTQDISKIVSYLKKRTANCAKLPLKNQVFEVRQIVPQILRKKSCDVNNGISSISKDIISKYVQWALQKKGYCRNFYSYVGSTVQETTFPNQQISPCDVHQIPCMGVVIYHVK
jgi:hypothetical protein